MQADELTPEQAWQALVERPAAKLVDVRTVPEWLYVGEPDVSGADKPLLKISWHVFPEMTVNDRFIEELKAASSPDDMLLFLCRSGGRSLAAARAASAAGFRDAYSVAGGFEGPVNEQGHRSRIEGWKFAGLPWKQP